MSKRAQVSIEYLTAVLFGLLLAVAAGLLLNSVAVLGNAAKAKLLTYRDSAIATLMS